LWQQPKNKYPGDMMCKTLCSYTTILLLTGSLYKIDTHLGGNLLNDCWSYAFTLKIQAVHSCNNFYQPTWSHIPYAYDSTHHSRHHENLRTHRDSTKMMSIESESGVLNLKLTSKSKFGSQRHITNPYYRSISNIEHLF
jgi:hypothetical protein